MPAMDVLTIVAAGLAATLIIAHQLTGRQLKRLQREIAADEAARDVAGHPAE